MKNLNMRLLALGIVVAVLSVGLLLWLDQPRSGAEACGQALGLIGQQNAWFYDLQGPLQAYRPFPCASWLSARFQLDYVNPLFASALGALPGVVIMLFALARGLGLFDRSGVKPGTVDVS